MGAISTTATSTTDRKLNNTVNIKMQFKTHKHAICKFSNSQTCTTGILFEMMVNIACIVAVSCQVISGGASNNGREGYTHAGHML